MNFDFDVKRLLPDEVNRICGANLRNNFVTVGSPGSTPVSFRTAAAAAAAAAGGSHRWSHNSSKTRGDQLLNIIDCMGLASAKAQGLHHVITTGDKLRESEHVLYVMTDDGGDQTATTTNKHKVIGLLKIGYKKLFLMDRHGTQHEMRPPCVLDFYVHESYQRMGFGKRLFEFMMRDLNVDAHQLAIDRPSSKFLAFLSRHYQLSNPVHQGNHFTVFEDMFPARGEVALDSHWNKLRRSEPINTANCKSIVRSTGNRNSCPPAVDCRKGDSEIEKIHETRCSVASVVFGQLRQASQEICKASPPRGSFYSPRCERNMERTTRNGNGSGSTELLRSTAMDSSFNIFGVPSPDYGGSRVHRG